MNALVFLLSVSNELDAYTGLIVVFGITVSVATGLFVCVCLRTVTFFSFFFLRTHVWSAAPGTSGTPGTVPFPECHAAVPA